MKTETDMRLAQKMRGRGIHPVIDTLEMRLRCELLRHAGTARTPEEVIRRALEYAAEAEQRIGELSARVKLLESLAETDELTGLMNRRGFHDVLYRNLASAARHEETGVLAYLDLDRFKNVNDTHGHAAGDEVLRKVGQFLKKNIRATDYAARIGGDEFAILFVRGDHIRARERARELMARLNGLTVRWGEAKIAVQASLGLASYDGTANPLELLDLADRAMYRDKAAPKRRAPKARRA